MLSAFLPVVVRGRSLCAKYILILLFIYFSVASNLILSSRFDFGLIFGAKPITAVRACVCMCEAEIFMFHVNRLEIRV